MHRLLRSILTSASFLLLLLLLHFFSFSHRCSTCFSQLFPMFFRSISVYYGEICIYGRKINASRPSLILRLRIKFRNLIKLNIELPTNGVVELSSPSRRFFRSAFISSFARCPSFRVADNLPTFLLESQSVGGGRRERYGEPSIRSRLPKGVRREEEEVIMVVVVVISRKGDTERRASSE